MTDEEIETKISDTIQQLVQDIIDRNPDIMGLSINFRTSFFEHGVSPLHIEIARSCNHADSH